MSDSNPMGLPPIKRKTGWWISTEDEEMGPYDIKEEAEADYRGLKRFYKRWSKCPGGDECVC